MTEDELCQWRSRLDTASILGVSERTVTRAVSRGDVLRREYLGEVEFMPMNTPWTRQTLAGQGVSLVADEVLVADHPGDELKASIDELRDEVRRLRQDLDQERQARAAQARQHADKRHQSATLAGLIMWVWSWLKVQAEKIKRALA